MATDNLALWLPRPGGRFQVGPAPYPTPAAHEVVVRVRAVGINFIDGIPGFAYRLVLPWLTFPTVVGTDVAGEVVEVGSAVTRLAPGDRVLGHAAGLARSHNRAAEGAFQHYTVLMEHMVSPLPETLAFAQAAVLPLQVSTAATGLFQSDQLGLALPSAAPDHRGEVVLVWGGSTGVGSNAIQLARNAGYRVVASASPHNFGYLRSLGASEVVDRRSATAVDELREAIGDQPLAGTLAIGSGSLRPTIALASRTSGSGRIAAAQPALLTRVQSVGSSRRGVRVSAIWGGALMDSAVGPAIYVDFLPAALATGTYQSAPEAVIVGDGLDRIPEALHRLRKGVSAAKLVVTVQ
jgi:NADPH:quinone reductase-like Zn-dependent oxidoreductase